MNFSLLSFKKRSYDKDFWPISLGDLSKMLGAWNGFSANCRKRFLKCLVVYFSATRYTLPYVTKEIDKSEKLSDTLTFKWAILNQWKIWDKIFSQFPVVTKYFLKTPEVEKSFDLIFRSICFRTLVYNGWKNLKQLKGFFSPDALKCSSNIDERNQSLKLTLITCVVNVILYLGFNASRCFSVICIVISNTQIL